MLRAFHYMRCSNHRITITLSRRELIAEIFERQVRHLFAAEDFMVRVTIPTLVLSYVEHMPSPSKADMRLIL